MPSVPHDRLDLSFLKACNNSWSVTAPKLKQPILDAELSYTDLKYRASAISAPPSTTTPSTIIVVVQPSVDLNLPTALQNDIGLFTISCSKEEV
ncbi:hypothetical protein J6590_049185 [Homalodisca vitripennis]|nr:hypothetical protein J6590_049185 [Homalodisca vitripennis]